MPIVTRSIRILLAASLFWLSGCGNGLSGGSIPIGLRSVIRGRVVAADAPSTPLTNVRITLHVPQGNGLITTTQMLVDSTGSFNFPSVTMGTKSANVEVITTIGDTNYIGQIITIPVEAGRGTSMLISLPKKSFILESVKSIKLSPQVLSLETNIPAQITVRALGASNNFLNIYPTLVLSGNIGFLGLNQLITPTNPGSGTVTAYWYGGITSDFVQINVANGINHDPPPPPPPDNGSGDDPLPTKSAKH